MKGFLVCMKHPDQPFGVPLEKRQWTDMSEGRCPQCRCTYDRVILAHFGDPNHCPHCQQPLKVVVQTERVCPICHPKEAAK